MSGSVLELPTRDSVRVSRVVHGRGVVSTSGHQATQKAYFLSDPLFFQNHIFEIFPSQEIVCFQQLKFDYLQVSTAAREVWRRRQPRQQRQIGDDDELATILTW